MKEIWKDIAGYEGHYQVSNFGNVRSVDRFVRANQNGLRLIKGQEIKKRYDKDGYLVVMLKKANLPNKLAKVHRLVASAFISRTDLFRDSIDHINGVRDDNRCDNLRWCSTKENNSFSNAQKNRSKSIRQSYVENPSLRKERSLIWSKKVLVKKDGVVIRKFDSQHELAQWLDVRDMVVSDILNNNIGNRFEYTFERI